MGGFWDGGDPASASCLYKRTELCVCCTTTTRDRVVGTVRVGFRPRKVCGPGAYKSVPLDEMEVAIQRLVLLEPKEEVGKEREAVGGAEVQDAEK